MEQRSAVGVVERKTIPQKRRSKPADFPDFSLNGLVQLADIRRVKVERIGGLGGFEAKVYAVDVETTREIAILQQLAWVVAIEIVVPSSEIHLNFPFLEERRDRRRCGRIGRGGRWRFLSGCRK